MDDSAVVSWAESGSTDSVECSAGTSPDEVWCGPEDDEAGGAALPYVRVTITEEQTCRPFDEPFHACEPAGPDDPCPDPPKWSCDATEVRTYTIRMAWARGSHVDDIDLSAHLGWGLDEPGDQG